MQSVERVTGIMGEIEAAAREQSEGIEQVNKAITQIDEVTQHNAALVEEAAASAKSLEEQAVILLEAVSVFRIGNTPANGAARTTDRPDSREAHGTRSNFTFEARRIKPSGT